MTAAAASARWVERREDLHELLDGQGETVGFVRYDRGGWDTFSLRLHGYIGPGAAGAGADGLARAKTRMKQHAAQTQE